MSGGDHGVSLEDRQRTAADLISTNYYTNINPNSYLGANPG